MDQARDSLTIEVDGNLLPEDHELHDFFKKTGGPWNYRAGGRIKVDGELRNVKVVEYDQAVNKLRITTAPQEHERVVTLTEEEAKVAYAVVRAWLREAAPGSGRTRSAAL